MIIQMGSHRVPRHLLQRPILTSSKTTQVQFLSRKSSWLNRINKLPNQDQGNNSSSRTFQSLNFNRVHLRRAIHQTVLNYLHKSLNSMLLKCRKNRKGGSLRFQMHQSSKFQALLIKRGLRKILSSWRLLHKNLRVQLRGRLKKKRRIRKVSTQISMRMTLKRRRGRAKVQIKA